MKSLFLILAIIIVAFSNQAIAQDSLKRNNINKKTGFGFAGVPVISYDTDLGLKIRTYTKCISLW